MKTQGQKIKISQESFFYRLITRFVVNRADMITCDAEHVKNALQLSDVFKQSLNPYFLDTYGWAQLKNGDMDTAMTVFNKVIFIAPDIPVFRYHLAVGYHKLGDKLAAISELKQAIQLGKGKVYPERKMTEELLAELK